MKKRKAETLAEFLMAALVFGIVMAGTFEFIAYHTKTIANISARDEIMQQAQWSMDYYYFTKLKSPISQGVISIDRANGNGMRFLSDDKKDPKVLTVIKGSHMMTFAFKESK